MLGFATLMILSAMNAFYLGWRPGSAFLEASWIIGGIVVFVMILSRFSSRGLRE